MPKFTPYETQVRPQGARADARAFGGQTAQGMQAVGQSLQQMGDKLHVLQQRQQSRKDVVESVRSKSAFRMGLDQEFQRMTDEDDLTDTEVSNRFAAFVDQQIQERVSAFNGSEDARAKLHAEMEQEKSSYVQRMYKASVSAGYKAVDTELKNHGKMVSDMTGDDPSSLPVAFQSIDAIVQEMSPAIPKGAEDEYRMMLKGQAVQSAYATHAAREDWDAAEAIVDTEGVQEVLDSNTYRQMKTQIIVARRADEKADAQLRNDLAKATAIAGIQADKEIQVAAFKASLSSQGRKWSEMSPMEKAASINADRISRGLPELTIDEESKLMGVFTPAHQRSQEERQLSAMTETADAIAAGVADPNEVKRFQNAYAIYAQTKNYKDENGNIVQVQPRMPPHLQRAVETLGLDKQAASSYGNGVQAPGGVEIETEGEPVSFDKTMLGMNTAGNLTGPAATAERWAHEFAPTSSFVGGETSAAYDYFKQKTEGLYRLFSENPKFPVGELERIRESFNKGPKFWQSQSGITSVLGTTFRSLIERRQRNLGEAVNNRDPKARNIAMREVRAINDYLKYLGGDYIAPVKSPEDVWKMQESGEIQGVRYLLLENGEMIPVPENGFSRPEGEQNAE